MWRPLPPSNVRFFELTAFTCHERFSHFLRIASVTNTETYRERYISTYAYRNSGLYARLYHAFLVIYNPTMNHYVNAHASSIFKLFSVETTGPIFTKILHHIVALVAICSKTKTLPSSERAKNALVSICLRSFVSSGAAVNCWQSFDVPSATASAEA